MNFKETFLHEFYPFKNQSEIDRVTWQRLTSRLCIFGEPSQEVPASILQLRTNPTHMVMSENLASDICADEFFQY